MRLYGLIGYPLTQSFSKKYFKEKFEKEGLADCRFENFQIASINEFTGLINGHSNLQGLAVTIPFKQQVLTYLDSAENIPAGLKACNCIKFRDGKLLGFNTDYIGFEKSLDPLLKTHHTQALVLGNGEATEAVVYVLKEKGIAYHIVSRKLHDDSMLTYSDITEDLIKESPLIINTTPLGMYPNVDEYPPIPYSCLSERHLLYDLVYNPEKTLFLQKGEERGATIKNGHEMLVLQAEENWRIWNS